MEEKVEINLKEFADHYREGAQVFRLLLKEERKNSSNLIDEIRRLRRTIDALEKEKQKLSQRIGEYEYILSGGSVREATRLSVLSWYLRKCGDISDEVIDNIGDGLKADGDHLLAEYVVSLKKIVPEVNQENLAYLRKLGKADFVRGEVVNK